MIDAPFVERVKFAPAPAFIREVSAVEKELAAVEAQAARFFGRLDWAERLIAA